MEMFLISTGCALFAVGAILIIGPGKRSTPMFTTGVVTGLLGTAALMAYSLASGLSPLKIVLCVIWVLVIASTAVYAIRSRKNRRENHSGPSSAERETSHSQSALAEMTQITQHTEATPVDTDQAPIKRLSELDD